MKAVVLVGIPASGKSTEALKYKVQGYKELNRDNARFYLFNRGVRDWTKYKFSKENEGKVTEYLDNLLRLFAAAGKNVVVSDTNLNTTYREQLIDKLEDLGYEVEIKVIHCTLEEAWKRDANRQGGVGKDIIYSMYQKYLEYIDRKTYTPDEEKQDCIIVDIDGTVAQMNGRSPFEWNKVGEDLPRKEILDIVHNLSYDQDYELIFLSGRDSICRHETEEWLNNQIHFKEENLFMRAESDHRKDTVIKEELFWEHIAPYYNVKMAIDDRPCMVRLWHELKIPTVISVADPFKEF